jgi:hypothetical protein
MMWRQMRALGQLAPNSTLQAQQQVRVLSFSLQSDVGGLYVIVNGC